MKQLSVLFIEDDEIERMKFNRICVNNNFNCTITEAKNGEEALTFLEDATILPSLILLDLNMPKMNGFEFLQKTKSDSRLKHIPTTVISSSDNYNDIKKAYQLGASGYMIKPLKMQDYQEKIITIYNYWKNNELLSE